MAVFYHEVPPEVRAASHWDEASACYVAPDGREWRYTSDPSRSDGPEWRDGHNQPLAVAVWLLEE